MAYQGINTGTGPNSGTGDTLLSGADKINSNFEELYTLLGNGSTLAVGIVTGIVAGENVSVSSTFGTVTVSAATSGIVVTGPSTFIGLTTVTGDLYVSGDLYVADDIQYDEVNGRNLNISGVGTVATLGVTTALTVTGVTTLGVTTFNGNVSVGSSFFFGDNNQIIMGAQDDFQIYHTDSDGNVLRTNVGNLNIVGDNANMVSLSGTAVVMATNVDSNFGVELYYNNQKKFDTKATGVDVTGRVNATSFAGDGANLTGISTLIEAGANITVTTNSGITTISAAAGVSTANINADTLVVTGITTLGVVTGATYFGDGSNLTGLSGITTAAINANSIVVTGISTLGVVTGATYFGDGSNLTGVGGGNTANVSTNTLNVVGVTTTGTVFVTGETSGGSTTDYTEVTISGTTGFDNTYAAQSSGFTLDGGTVASGSATFNSNSNYLYYVATSGPQADGRIIIFSEVDNAWFALVVIGANFTEGNVSNDQALGFAAGAESLTTSTEVGDGKNVPQSSADIVYTTSGGGTTTGVGVTIRTDGDAIFAGVVTATSFRGDGSQLTGVGGGNTANVSTNTLNVIGVTTASDVNITGIVTAGIGTIRSLRVGAGAGPSAPNGQLAVVNATGVAAFTVGQNVDGSGQNHLGIYYNGPAAPIASQIFTSNGIMRFVTDGGGGGALPLIQQSGFQFGVNGNFSNTPLVSIHDVTPATGVSTALVVNGQTLLNGGVNVSGITTLGVTTIGGNLTYSGNDLTFDGSNQQAFFPSDSAFGLEMRTTASPFLVFDTRSTTPFIVCQQAVSFALNSTTPTMTNSTMTIQLNSDTELQFTVKGSDGVNRTATLTLS